MAIQDYQNGEEKPHTPQGIAEPTKLVDESRRNFSKSGLIASGVLLTLASRPVLGQVVCQSPSGAVSGNLSHHGSTPPGGYNCQHWINSCKSWVNCEPSKPFCDEFGFNCGVNPSYGCYVTYNFSSHQYKKNGGGMGSEYVKYTNFDILSRYHAGYQTQTSGSYSGCDVTTDTYGNHQNGFYTTGTCGNLTLYRKIEEYAVLDQLAQHCVAALLNCRAGLTPFLLESTVKEMFNECVAGRSFHPMAGEDWDASECIRYIQSTWNCA